MSKSKANASVLCNEDFFKVITISQGMLNYADPDVAPRLLAPDAADEPLGHAVRRALADSKRIGLSEFQALLKSKAVQNASKEHEAALMSQHGYKSRRAMFINMKCCDVAVYDDRIEIQPQHHNSIDGFSATKQDQAKILSLAIDATDAELGATLKQAFLRCTSGWL
jgi:hypothetical protein